MWPIDTQADRIQAMLPVDRRLIVGVTGVPGAGKSTLVLKVCDELNARGIKTTVVPMDGFHLADQALTAHGTLAEKGAIHTFDGWGYLATLKRLRSETDHSVFVPAFERDLEQPIAGAIEVHPNVRVILTEGNYLLDDSQPWVQVRELMDEVWFVEQPNEQRIQNLIQRHVQFGKSPEDARDWVLRVDEVNALRVDNSRGRADLVITAQD